MRFLHRKYSAKRHEAIQVELDGPAIVKFMTATEFKKYAGGRTHTYFRGQGDERVLRFTLPFDSIWHAVVEQGKDGGLANAKSKLCEPSAARPQLGRNTDLADLDEVERELKAVSMGGRSEG